VSPAPMCLQVSNLTVHHGGLLALHDVSIDVAEGEIAGLIGPNGAGKTTFIDTLSGFTTATSGRVRLDGEQLDHLPAHERARRGLVRTFQSLELFDDLTVRENLLVAAAPPRRGSFVADLFRSRPAEPEGVDEILAELELDQVGRRRPDELSNGQRHLVALARALVTRPRLVLLDEPAAGLDTHETAELADVLRSLPGRGVTVLLVDHDMSVVLGVCDTVHVLDFGGLIASGSPSQIRTDPMVISAYLGTQGPT
jgi:branched-chain amino acid transport system ATP-binding protein